MFRTFHAFLLFPLTLLASIAVAAPADDARPPTAPPGAEAPADLVAELAKAKARIAELEAEVAALKAQLAKAPSAPVPPPPEAAGADPVPGPAVLRRELEAEYTDSLAEILPAPGDEAAAAVFRRELERWAASVNRAFRRPVRWHVRLVGTEPQGERSVVTLSPIDPSTGAAIGEEFTATLEARLARRVAAAGRADAGGTPWILAGTFVPEVRARPDRMERGIFDNPPLLGPGAEFRWRVEVESLAPARKEKPAEPAPAAP